MVDVEQWAEIRRMHFVAGLSIKEIARRTGRDRTRSGGRCGLRSRPRYRRAERRSKLDPFREEIHRLLREDGELPGQVIRERLQELGYPSTFHIGFFIDGEDRVDEINRRLNEDGFEIPPPSRSHAYGFYVQAPGGFTVELGA